MKNNIQQEDENVQTFLDVRLDKTTFSVMPSFESSESDDTRYWWAQTPAERIRHIERLRRINYGAQATARLQRVFEVTQRPSR
jgi:hypothetical protein